MSSSPLQILLVDDDEDEFVLVQRYCSRFAARSAEVSWCGTFEGALAALASTTPDVVLVDYRLGGRNGLDLLREATPLCRSPFIVLTGQGGHEVDLEAMQAGASDYLVKSEINPGILERAIRYAIERRRTEDRLNHLAMYDTLTGLANRVLFHDRLGREILHAQRAGTSVGLLFLDLDRFKTVNDSLGHGAGDELLRQVAARLSRVSRRTDTVARLGGDEFVLVLGELKSPTLAEEVAERVKAAFEAPFELDGKVAHVTASIGLTVYPRDTSDQTALLRNADLAMYSAKQSGRNRVQWFRAELAVRASRRLDLENRLRHAARNGEFALHYQPQIEIATGRIRSIEALLRWRFDRDTLVPPSEFLPIAEDLGLMPDIGQWVLRTALKDLATLRADGHELHHIAVNVSRTEVTNEWAQSVKKVLAETRIRPSSLEVELTETDFSADPVGMRTGLAEIHDVGVRIALDDFGTGYSSMASLIDFPIDVLKLDRRFIRDLSADRRAERMVQGVVNLCEGLGIQLVAEGVETDSQLEFLSAANCPMAQGYLLARPMPLSALAERLKASAE